MAVTNRHWCFYRSHPLLDVLARSKNIKDRLYTDQD